MERLVERGPVTYPWIERVEVREKGGGWSKPRHGSTYTVELEFGELSHPFHDDGSESSSPAAVETRVIKLGQSDDLREFLVDSCVESMVQGEKAAFRVDTSHFRAIIGDESPDSEVKAELVVKLLSFDSVESWGSKSGEELKRVALDLKARGVALYAQKRTYLALRRFSEAFKSLCILESLPLGDGEKRHVSKTKSQLYSNIAVIFLNVGRKDEWALELCQRGLSIDPDSVKLLYRRGWASLRLQNYDEAATDFLKVLELDPGNAAAVAKLNVIKSKKKDVDVRLGNAMKKLFV